MKLTQTLAGFLFAAGIAVQPGCSSQDFFPDNYAAPVSFVSFDFNDNYITEETVQSITEPSVLIQYQIGFEQGFCSGVAMKGNDNKSYVITSAHCLNFLPIQYLISSEAGGKHTALPYKTDFDSDLALLKLVGEYPNPFIGKVAPDVQVGQQLIGSSYVYEPFEKRSRQVYYQALVSANYHDTLQYQLIGEVELNPGSSGGGMYIMRQGKPFLAGISRNHFQRTPAIPDFEEIKEHSGMVSTKRLREFLKGTPLEDHL